MTSSSTQLRNELEYQQLRVLLLICDVSSLPGATGSVDSLTKLAKLDFIARYPDTADTISAALDGTHLLESPTVEAKLERPMIRHRFGPWDDTYYPVVGALVGRGLIRYRRGPRNSVVMQPTPAGKKLAEKVSASDNWGVVAAMYSEVARRFGNRSGNQLKDAIYAALPNAMDVAHRTELN